MWFDQSELRGGVEWDREIRAQIRTCALFIPILSSAALSRHEGYFRLEWNLAEQRAQMMGRGRPFIMPVSIDASSDADADVPEVFLRVQWTQLSDEASMRSLVARIGQLLETRDGKLALPETGRSTGSSIPEQAQDVSVTARRRWPAIACVAGALICAGLAYRFLTHPASPPAAKVESAVRSPATAMSVAVLPFLDLSEKKDQEYFSDGLSEELIERLGQIGGLKVIARTSSFFFKGKPNTITEIASTLGVTHILEGSVRRAGARVRVTAQLIQASDGSHLWAQTYDRQFDDIFQTQDDITSAVVGALSRQLVPAQPQAASHAIQPAAYDQFLLGQALDRQATVDACMKASVAFRKAIELDPGYSRPYAELSKCETFLVNFRGGGSLAAAREYADRSIQLAPDDISGYLARAYLHIWGDLDAPAARADVERMRTLGQNDTDWWRRLGDVLSAYGRLPEAVAAEKRAVDIDPLSGLGWSYLAVMLTCNHQYAEAGLAFDRQETLGFAMANVSWNRARLEVLDGHLQSALERTAHMDLAVGRLQVVAMAEDMLGHRDRSAAAIQDLIAKEAADSPLEIAEALAWTHHVGQALDWLERAEKTRDYSMASLRSSPFLDSVRQDPRYAAMIRRLQLE